VLAKADSGFHASEQLELGTPTWRDVPAGWVATVGINGEWAGGNAQDFRRGWLVFAGVGPSGKPSCTAPLLYREKVTMAVDESEKSTEDRNWRLTPTWLPDGQLELRRAHGKGRVHRIVLP
jgi:hypothetical protein